MSSHIRPHETHTIKQSACVKCKLSVNDPEIQWVCSKAATPGDTATPKPDPLKLYRRQLASEGIEMNREGRISTSPCPFRHLEDVSRSPLLSWNDPDGEGVIFWVTCKGCGAQGPLEGSPVEAVRSWAGREEGTR